MDLGAAIEQGRYIALDAADTISTFVVDSMLDTARFMDGFGNLIQKARKAAKASHAALPFSGKVHIFCGSGVTH